MTFLLDTDACIQFLNGTSSRLAQRLRSHRPTDLSLCSIVKAELLYGARKSRRTAENLRLLNRFFDPFASLAFDDRCSDQYGKIRAQLEAEGSLIGPSDLAIAATAIANDATLVTHDTAEFQRVVGLALEDWE